MADRTTAIAIFDDRTQAQRAIEQLKRARITVELLLRSLSEGATEADLLEAYPHLTHEDIQAAIAYAADAVGREKQTPLNNRA